MAGALSIGTALTVRVLSDAATNPLAAGIAPEINQLLELGVSWDRLHQPFRAPLLPVEDPAAAPCPSLVGEVVFDSVSFAYPHTGRTILHDVSFTVRAGTVTALVGYTGAGKSSISKLLMRVYDPDSGVVTVDGFDLRRLDLADYRSRLGVVPQDAFVFRGTVASNIAYGRPGATSAEIEEAARAVGADAVLARLPGGYAHPVEEAGNNLTAAERQLVALARAWIATPQILVLDEATSSLDADLERAVLDAVKRLGCTTIAVTHRPSVVAVADDVVVLDSGRVAQTGTPKSMRKAGTAYDRLWNTVPEARPGLDVAPAP